jgi:hypothetical protein
MTLVGLLTGRLAPGVWRVDEEPSGIESLAAGLGWTVRRFSTDEDKGRLIGAVADAAGAPSYVRGNWDSIADGLKDIEPPAGGRLLLLAETSGTAHDQILTDILDEACAFLSRFDVHLQVLWVGPGEAPHLTAVDPIRANRPGRTARTGRMPAR